MPAKIPVHVIDLQHIDLNCAAHRQALELRIDALKERYAEGAIRCYCVEQYSSDVLAKYNIDIPWGKALISGRMDSDLYRMADEFFARWVSAASSAAYRRLHLVPMLHDDFVRRFRNHLLVHALAQSDAGTQEFKAHVVLTIFPYVPNISGSHFMIRERIALLNHVPPATIKGAIKHLVLNVVSWWRNRYGFSPMAEKLFWPAVSALRVCRACRGLRFTLSCDERLVPGPGFQKKHRILLVVTEALGRKNSLEPLPRLTACLSAKPDTGWLLLVENEYSQQYLRQHEVPSIMPQGSLSIPGVWNTWRASVAAKQAAARLGAAAKGSLPELLCRLIQDASIEDYLVDLVLRIEFVQRVLEDFSPTAVLAYPEECYSPMAAIYLAKNRRIPSLTFFQCIISDHAIYNIKHADKIAIYGTHGLEMLRRLGFDPKTIILTGNPKLDAITADAKDSLLAKAKSLLPEWDGRPLVVIATHLIEHDSKENVARFLEAMSHPDAAGFDVAIKAHPDEDRALYETLIQSNCPSRKVAIICGGDPYPLLASAAAVVTCTSTCGAEAALFDKPVLVLNVTGAYFNVDYVKEGIAVEIRSAEQALPALKRVLFDAAASESLREGRQRFIERYAWKMDGRSGERLAESLLQTRCPMPEPAEASE